MIRDCNDVDVSLISTSFHSHRPDITMAGMEAETPAPKHHDVYPFFALFEVFIDLPT